MSRRAHEDRKLRSAEEVILAAKMPSSKSTAADTGNKEYRAQQPPPPGHSASDKNCERSSNATTGRNTPGATSNNTRPLLLANQHGRSINSDSDNRNILDNSGRLDNSMARDGGACGHENLVDVSRRPARAPRKYAEEELDRYGESHSSSTTTKVGPLQFAPSSLISMDGGDGGNGGDSGRGARRTPRRVPVRPNASGKGVTRGRVPGDSGIRSGSASPRAVRGKLVVSQSLSAR